MSSSTKKQWQPESRDYFVFGGNAKDSEPRRQHLRKARQKPVPRKLQPDSSPASWKSFIHCHPVVYSSVQHTQHTSLKQWGRQSGMSKSTISKGNQISKLQCTFRAWKTQTSGLTESHSSYAPQLPGAKILFPLIVYILNFVQHCSLLNLSNSVTP